MSLSFRDKQSLYHNLGQLLRSGITFPAALRSLATTSRGDLRRLLQRLTRAIDGGSTVAEAFAAQRPTIGEMETSIADAVERAGRLDRGLAQLADYFGALATARSVVIKKAAYPVFVLHFGIIVLGLPGLLAEGPAAYLRSVGLILAVVYGIAIPLVIVARVLGDLGRGSAFIDALLRMIPMVGGIRENFAVSRFCATFEMQLGAGVNVMDALKAAGRAAQSGMIAQAVRRALPQVTAGEQVGPQLARSHAFPEAMLRDFAVGEQTGQLDEVLDRLTDEHRRAALSRLETLAEWLPRMLYLAVVAYIGYRIVSWYAGYLQQVTNLFQNQ